MLTTVGCSVFADNVSKFDAPFVTMLKQAGAIVLVKGNIP